MPRTMRMSTTPAQKKERPTRQKKASGSNDEGVERSGSTQPDNGAQHGAANGATHGDAQPPGRPLSLVTTSEVPYLDIFNSVVMPWFMEGVRQLQSDDHSYPFRSHAKDRNMTEIHRSHPDLAFGFDDEDGVVAYEMLDYESAGLWTDEQGEIALVVKPEFDDGQNDMLLLYKSNQVESVADVKRACQWAVVSGKAKKSKPTKRPSTAPRKSTGKKKRKS